MSTGAARLAANLVALLAVAGLAGLLIALGVFTWPSADDFCNRVLVDTRGFTGALHWLFFEWSGRVATGVPLYAAFALIDLPSIRAISMLLAAGLALVAWQSAGFVTTRPQRPSLPLFAFVLAALALGLYPLLGQTVYWATGGIVYLLPLMLLLHWLRGMRALVVLHHPAARGNAYWFLISAAVGNAIELVFPIVACYLAITAGVRWRTLSPIVRRAVAWRAAGLVTGAALLVGAPGNYLRAKATPDSFRFDPAFLAGQYGDMLRMSAETGATMLVIVIGLTMLAGALTAWRAKHHAMPARDVIALVHADEVVALALGAVLSLLPLLAAPAQFAPRNSLYMLVCLLLAALLPVVNVVFDARATRYGAYSVCAALSLVGSLVAGSKLVGDMRLADARRQEQVARDHRLRHAAAGGTRAITVGPIAAPAPSSLHAIDIAADPHRLVNWCVATYYHLGSVALDAGKPPQ